MAEDDWIEKLRRTIRESGRSLNEIERETGADHSALSRFMRGARTITFPVAAKVGAYLGMKLVEPAAAKAKKGRKP